MDEIALIKDELSTKQKIINKSLEKFCSAKPENTPKRLWEAMTYSLLAGGKRLRPSLCLMAGEVMGGNSEKLMPMALSLEMIHTASLIHDDLPSMDNDTLRRGKPTNHVVFGESMAILAGDALLSMGFQYPLRELPKHGFSSDYVVRALSDFAAAVGPQGICGGQVLDTDGGSQEKSKNFVGNIALQKTAVLIRTSVVTGVILAGGSEEQLSAFSQYGIHLGLAFQIIDDILDVIGIAGKVGKTLGKDEEAHKLTYVSSYGIDGARSLAVNETELARRALEPWGKRTASLRGLAEYLQSRTI